MNLNQDFPYRSVPPIHTDPSCYRYTGHRLSGGTAKIDHRRLIEGEKGKKKKRKRRKKRRRRKNTSRRPCPRAVAALARDFSPAQGERSRRPHTLKHFAD
ncbi:hypothetical protein BHE74_00053508 [Ensete ventricosum]|nr:hypothetical protein BHE74_00053508 [Ensete ventricosum]RZS17286.1 hypothetical protein BHM03_00049426 [Ensete ventricosum]